MKKILIDTNEARAQQTIAAYIQKAKRMTAILSEYNKSGLEALSRQSALEFLKNPKKHLDAKLIEESGLKVKNIQPDKVAELMAVPYRKILSFITPWDIQDFVIDENLKVTLSSEKQAQIVEESKFYLEKPDQIAAYRKMQKLCEMLNTHCDSMKIDNFDLNHVSRFLKLDTAANKDGRYQFTPNVLLLKKMLSD